MAAVLFSHSCEAASNLYTSAIASLSTIPTLLPSSPSSPMFSLYASSIFNSPVSFGFDIPSHSLPMLPTITIPLPFGDLVQDLSYWQIANVCWFVLTVGILSWMLDSHHSDDYTDMPDSPLPIETTAAFQPVKLSVPPSVRSQRRRQTLETIATLINLEDIHNKTKSRNRARKLRSRLPSVDNTTTSVPTSPTEAHGFISSPTGNSTALLKQASEREKGRQRRRSIQDDLVKRNLEYVANYDAGMQAKSEEADMRRKGSWKTGMLVGLRIPVGWTMS